MMSSAQRESAGRRAFSLLEVVISTVITGVLLVAAMRALGASLRSGLAVSDRCRAELLATDLMGEVLAQKYVEPDNVPVFGPDLNEGGGSRASFDDVDDYHNWSASPPQDKDGAVIANHQGWRRSVQVSYVSAGDLTKAVVLDEGAKRIIVTVERGGSVLATRLGVRTNHGQ